MAGNSYGELLKITTFGESHGPAIGVVIDGVPPKLPLTEKDIQVELDRRRPGQSAITTQRREKDKAVILSGVINGKTTGTPLAIFVANQDQRSKDYSKIKNLFRPGHADFTYMQKYGIRDYRGGGRSSGRETACRVAAGAVAKKILEKAKIRVYGYTLAVDDIYAQTITLSEIEKNPVRSPDKKAAKLMMERIKEVRDAGDSVGGIVEILVKNCPAGLGDPVFDKLSARLAHGLFSIATIKGLEFGAGFAAASMKASEHNDPFVVKSGKIRAATNLAGGMLGGISSGEEIVMRMAVKPPSSIALKQNTVTAAKKKATIKVEGRHDPCLCPRIVPVAEAMVALTLADCWLVQRSYR